MKEKEIIQPVARELLKKDLSDDKFLRHTHKGHNEIYVIDAHNSPDAMREVARLREVSFRQARGGTGKELDMDDYDTASPPYQQLIVWDPQAQEIVGGYRYILCRDVEKNARGIPKLATAGLFNFSAEFIKDYLPNTIELGRSFVQPAYQPSRDNRKSIYSLDNLWDGLGALVVDYPEIKYFFGKVTMYTHFNAFARDLILYFLHRFFPDKDNLVYPIEPLPLKHPEEELEKVFKGNDYEKNFKILFQEVRKCNENIPPLINSYMSLSPTMKTFGTAFNEYFGGVEETAILINIDDIYEKKKERHIKTYAGNK